MPPCRPPQPRVPAPWSERATGGPARSWRLARGTASRLLHRRQQHRSHLRGEELVPNLAVGLHGFQQVHHVALDGPGVQQQSSVLSGTAKKRPPHGCVHAGSFATPARSLELLASRLRHGGRSYWPRDSPNFATSSNRSAAIMFPKRRGRIPRNHGRVSHRRAWRALAPSQAAQTP